MVVLKKMVKNIGVISILGKNYLFKCKNWVHDKGSKDGKIIFVSCLSVHSTTTKAPKSAYDSR